MTISSEVRKAGPFAGNDSTTVFAFSFKVFAAGDLRVVKTSTAGVESDLVLNSDYSVSLNADQNVSPGGSITYPISGSPLATGEKLTIASDVDELQPTDLTNGGGFYPEVIEDTFDRAVILIQQLRELLGRTLSYPLSDAAAAAELPTATSRANKFLGFDASGNPIASASLGAFTVSSFIEGLLDDADAPTARATLGITKAVSDPAVIYVEDYGAVGDGSTDDAAAIQAAIDAAEALVVAGASGATVRFLGKRYRINSGLTIERNGIHLVGAGWAATQLMFFGGTTVDAIKFGAADPTTTELAGNGIRGMQITNYTANPTTAHGVKLDRCRLFIGRELYVVNFRTGIGIYGGLETIMFDTLDVQSGSIYSASSAGELIKIDRRQVASGQPAAVEDPNAPGTYYVMPYSVYISNANLRGMITTYRPTYCIFVGACDGLYMSNIHAGFSELTVLHFKQSQQNLYIANVNVVGLFLDPSPGTTDIGIYYEAASFATANIFRHFYSGFIVSGASSTGILIAEDNVTDVRFANGRISDSSGPGVNISGDVNRVSFDHVSFHNNNQAASTHAHALVTSGDRVAFSNCDFTGTGYRGIQAADVGATVTTLSIVGCRFFSTTDVAMLLNQADRNIVVQGCISDKSRTIASAAAITAPYEHDTIIVTGTTNINTINNQYAGRKLTIIFTGALTLTDGTPARMAGNFTTSADDVLELVSDGTTWYERSRSVN